VAGCQKDHFHFSATIKGIFWYEPALFPVIYKILRSSHFGMTDTEAREMLHLCFAVENDAINQSYDLHRTAWQSYKSYVDSITYLDHRNRDMTIMEKSSVRNYLKTNARALRGLQAVV
jgi:hypothetical protein